MRGWGVLVTTVYMHVLFGIKDIVNKYFCWKKWSAFDNRCQHMIFFMISHKYNMHLKYKSHCFGAFRNSKEQIMFTFSTKFK